MDERTSGTGRGARGRWLRRVGGLIRSDAAISLAPAVGPPRGRTPPPQAPTPSSPPPSSPPPSSPAAPGRASPDSAGGTAAEVAAPPGTTAGAPTAPARRPAPALLPGALPRPLHCEWVWRPAPWQTPLQPAEAAAVDSGTPLAPGVSLHHDRPGTGYAQRPGHGPGHGAGQGPERGAGPGADPGAGQAAGHGAGPDAGWGTAPQVLRLTAGPGEGFVSLAIDLPAEAAEGLAPRHLIGLRLALAAPTGGGLQLRLNLRHGPNLAQMVQEVAPDARRPDGALLEFDLAYGDINLRRVSQIWCDILFFGPDFTTAELTEATFSRRPRADF